MNKELLQKYFQNKCSPEEVKDVVEWMESAASRTELEEHFDKDWNSLKVNSGNSDRWKKLLDKVHEKITMEELYGTLNLPGELQASNTQRKGRSPVPHIRQHSKTRRRLAGMAVVVVGILCFSSFYYWGQRGKDAPTQIAEKTIQKSTDKGQKLTIHLNDGSTVVLNSGSQLEYPEYFAENERVVHLTGEGFFQVARDAQRPFRVVTGPLVTTALGTSFNIKSNKHDGTVEVALVTGKVMVGKKAQRKNIVLNPGQMLSYNDQKGHFDQKHFDIAKTIAWKDGVLVFSNASYAEIKTDLENWFGVNIIDNKVPKQNWQFTAKFDNENLENILDALQFGHPFHYKIDRKQVVIKF